MCTACRSSTSSASMRAPPACWPSARTAAPSAELIGEENRGLEYMFIMMNAARYSVGIEGVGLSERAYQTALAYARERVQGTEAGVRGGARVPIVRHPDVRRMLLLMKSQTEAMRALAAVVAVSLDAARLHPDAAERERHQAFADLMIPVVKGWCTENSVDIASLGHPGARRRGIRRGNRRGAVFARCAHHADLRGHDRHSGQRSDRPQARARRRPRRADGHRARCGRWRRSLRAEPQSVGARRRRFPPPSTRWNARSRYVVENYATDIRSVSVGAVPMLKLFGIVAGGWQLLRSASIAQQRLAAPRTGAPTRTSIEAKISDRALLRGPRAVAGAGTGAQHRARRRRCARRGCALSDGMDGRYPQPHRLPDRRAH